MMDTNMQSYLEKIQAEHEISAFGSAVAMMVNKIALKQIDRYCPPEQYEYARYQMEKDLHQALKDCGYYK